MKTTLWIASARWKPRTDGRYRWSETAGLKQLIREQALSDTGGAGLRVARDYPASGR